MHGVPGKPARLHVAVAPKREIEQRMPLNMGVRIVQKIKNHANRFTFEDEDFAIWTNPCIDVSLPNLVKFSTNLIFQ